jgi:hypothetical protein
MRLARQYADRKQLRGDVRWLKKGENARTQNAGVPRPAAAIIAAITVRIQACQFKAIMTNRWIQARN